MNGFLRQNFCRPFLKKIMNGAVCAFSTLESSRCSPSILLLARGVEMKCESAAIIVLNLGQTAADRRRQPSGDADPRLALVLARPPGDSRTNQMPGVPNSAARAAAQRSLIARPCLVGEEPVLVTKSADPNHTRRPVARASLN